MPPALLDDLIDWLRIPSISTGGGRRADLDAAAQWAATRVREAGGEAELVRIAEHSSDASLFGVDAPAIRLAATALQRACEVEPAFVRIGGSIPIVAEFAAKGLPTVVIGFVLPGDAFHAANESFALHSLELGERAARELPLEIAQLPT